MITHEDLRQRLSPEFGEFDRVSDAILQCTRSFKGTPFAACYFDTSGDLPETPSALTTYQDAVIGPRFFRLRESLQWSTYLYFVISADRVGDPDTAAIRSMIECDRSYARKRVITDSEISELFGVAPTTPGASSSEENIVDVWARILAEAGIDGAVFSEEDLPARLARIENTEQRPVKRAFRRGAAPRRFEPFVRRLELRDYREFPQKRQFEFGSFNLIFGPNGSGKTSLLEALEVFYCGRMQRNPGVKLEYDLRATLLNGETENANHRRRAEFFRGRSLSWYGRSEIKTRDLYRSFAQFNFLSTDAAVGIAEATEHLEDDLARLLIGPDASKIWRSIERVSEAVEQRLRECRQWKILHDDQLESLIAMGESRAEDRASPGLAARLRSVFVANGWEMVSDLSVGDLEGLVHDLAETASFAEQATTLDWRGEPASMEGVERYIVHAQSVIASVEQLMRDHEHDGAILVTEDAGLRRAEEALALAKQLVEFVKAQVTTKVDLCAAQDRLVRELRGVLADHGAVDLAMFPRSERDMTVSAAINAFERERDAANEALLDARRRQNEVSSTREGLDRLARELRGVASRILAGVDDVRECPLCHTSFSRPELQARIDRGIADERLERLSHDLVTRAAPAEAAIAAIDDRLKTLIWLRRYCERVSMGADVV
ncbi:MAG: AAA family ATPase, partial [Methylocystis sp.]